MLVKYIHIGIDIGFLLLGCIVTYHIIRSSTSGSGYKFLTQWMCFTALASTFLSPTDVITIFATGADLTYLWYLLVYCLQKGIRFYQKSHLHLRSPISPPPC